VATERNTAHPERGSALIIALLVTVILALLGISFLLMAETENRIARNERRAAQAFYVAQSTVRVVKRWFDAPGTAVASPGVADVERVQRVLLDETDPYDPADETPANGTPSAPYYKQGVDLDGNGSDDLFDRPYDGAAEHAFRGTEAGPDLVIDESDPEGALFLRTLEQRIFPGYPGDGIQARVARIELFAPPYVRSGSGWTRFGLATVRVLARLEVAADGRAVAEREVRSVLSEIPYRGVYGPLHSCAGLTFTGSNPTLHWGAVTARQSMRLSAALSSLPRSLPKELPTRPQVDPLLASLDWGDWSAEVAGEAVEDPWLRYLTGSALSAPPVPASPQPYPSPWDGWSAGDPPPGPCCDVYSHLSRDQPMVGCPSYDYDDWKAIASSGERGVHYFVWVGGDRFQEDGTGTIDTVQNLTNGREGIFFFDTANRLEPEDTDGDGDFDNLTGDVAVSGNWSFRGVLYLNASSFRLNGATGVPRTVQAPGEPFRDLDGDGLYDAGEPFVHLAYPSSTATLFQAPTILAPSGARAARGPAVPLAVSLEGLVVVQGTFEATGTGTAYGSVVAVSGVTQAVADGSEPTPRLLFDASLVEGFPPVGWGLPRATVTGWDTEP